MCSFSEMSLWVQNDTIQKVPYYRHLDDTKNAALEHLKEITWKQTRIKSQSHNHCKSKNMYLVYLLF